VKPDANVPDAPKLNQVLAEVYHSMERRKSAPDPLGQILNPEATASVKITQIQPDLKQITIIINYLDTTGVTQQYTKYKFIHKESGRAH